MPNAILCLASGTHMASSGFYLQLCCLRTHVLSWAGSTQYLQFSFTVFILRISNNMGSPLHLKLPLPSIMQWHLRASLQGIWLLPNTAWPHQIFPGRNGNLHYPITFAFCVLAKSTLSRHCLTVLRQASDGVSLPFTTAAVAFGGPRWNMGKTSA